MNPSGYVPGHSRIGTGIVVCGLAWAVAACGPGTHESRVVDGLTTPKTHSPASAPTQRAQTDYFGEEYSEEHEALSKQPTEMSAPSF